MIKKFEEINILKECLLTEEQVKMVEVISKPILSSKKLLLPVHNKEMRNLENSAELTKVINDFIIKFNNNRDEIDRKIFNVIEEYVKKSFP